jgi:hypothetical protein
MKHGRDVMHTKIYTWVLAKLRALGSRMMGDGVYSTLSDQAIRSGVYQVLVESAIRDMTEALHALETNPSVRVDDAISTLTLGRDYIQRRYLDIRGEREYFNSADDAMIWGKLPS